ncbi:MAG: glycogen phosphorylase, partial [Oscillospiraceae bacterium]|nr:glycogen phosphorylase [Oscillospiraceae bacterium]
MEFNCKQIVSQTQTLLKLQQDVSFEDASAAQLHDCLGQVIMMNITERWSECKRNRGTQRHAYYFSAEYLIGRLVYSNLFNLGILEELKALFADRGVDLAVLEDIEDDALG